MTFKELINSVNFEDVAPHIVRMYPDMKDSLGWFNLHFDLLRLTEPQYHRGSNADVCHITMKDWEDYLFHTKICSARRFCLIMHS